MSARVAVVIPARDHAQLMRGCLSAVCAEARRRDADVVVVDDASTDDLETVVAESCARYVRLDRAGGPYRARNVGWRSTDADVLVFADARTRPRTGWLDALVEAVRDPSVGVAGGDSLVPPGSTQLERFFAWWQPMEAQASLSHRFLPFVSGGNLAARREVLDSLGGFWETLSGGDADLCWRAQLVLDLAVVRAPGAVVDLVPRSNVVHALRQYHRYGFYGRRLERRFGIAPDPMADRPPVSGSALARAVRVARRRSAGRPLYWLLSRALLLAFRIGERRGERSLDRDPPEPFSRRPAT